jgi:hypothetical protein
MPPVRCGGKGPEVAVDGPTARIRAGGHDHDHDRDRDRDHDRATLDPIVVRRLPEVRGRRYRRSPLLTIPQA